MREALQQLPCPRGQADRRMAALHHGNMVAITDNEAADKYEGLAGIWGADNMHEVGRYNIGLHWAPPYRQSLDSIPRTPQPNRPPPGVPTPGAPSGPRPLRTWRRKPVAPGAPSSPRTPQPDRRMPGVPGAPGAPSSPRPSQPDGPMPGAPGAPSSPRPPQPDGSTPGAPGALSSPRPPQPDRPTPGVEHHDPRLQHNTREAIASSQGQEEQKAYAPEAPSSDGDATLCDDDELQHDASQGQAEREADAPEAPSSQDVSGETHAEHDGDLELRHQAEQVEADQRRGRAARAAAIEEEAQSSGGGATQDTAPPAVRPASPAPPTPSSRSCSPGPPRRKEGLPCRDLVQRKADVYVVSTQDEHSQFIMKVLWLRRDEVRKQNGAVFLDMATCARIERILYQEWLWEPHTQALGVRAYQNAQDMARERWARWERASPSDLYRRSMRSYWKTTVFHRYGGEIWLHTLIATGRVHATSVEIVNEVIGQRIREEAQREPVSDLDRAQPSTRPRSKAPASSQGHVRGVNHRRCAGHVLRQEARQADKDWQKLHDEWWYRYHQQGKYEPAELEAYYRRPWNQLQENADRLWAEANKISIELGYEYQQRDGQKWQPEGGKRIGIFEQWLIKLQERYSVGQIVWPPVESEEWAEAPSRGRLFDA